MGTGYFDDIDISQDAPVQGLNLNDYEQSITGVKAEIVLEDDKAKD